MTRVTLTGADLADLAAGLVFNTLDVDGDEIIVDGRSFTNEQVARLADGDQVVWNDYLLEAPERAWAGHRTPAELVRLQADQRRGR